MIRDHDKHRDAADLAVDMKRRMKLKRLEREREERRFQGLLPTSVVKHLTDEPDWDGCTL
jgi:hypothetical protein